MKRLTLIAALLVAATCLPASAQWAEDGKAVYTQGAFYTNPIRMVPDGLGGVLVLYDASYIIYDARVQRLSAAGERVWAPGGASVVASVADPVQPDIAPDGTGGCVVVWTDVRGGDGEIYAQRFDGESTPLWTPDGVLVLSRAGDQANPKVINDGFGNYIVVFEDYYYGNTNINIMAQRLDAAGDTTWAGGVEICAQPDNQQAPRIVPDGAGGAVIAWQDERSADYDIYAYRVDGAGSSTWTAGGVAVCTEIGVQGQARLVSDGQAGAVIVWRDERNFVTNVYAQRVLANGAMDWTGGGVDICTDLAGQYSIEIAGDDQGGAAIVWQDHRPAADSDIYAQYVDPDGDIMWGYNGTPVCSYTGNQTQPVIARCGDNGSYIVAWLDARVPALSRVYGQRVETTGATSWASDGVIVADAPTGDQYEPALCAEPALSGAVFAWWDERNLRNDLYAQRLTLRWSEWGFPEPTMHEVVDIPGDQGGYVAVKWWPSGRDVFPETLIGSYWVWHSLDPPEMPEGVSEASATDPDILSRYFDGATVVTNPGEIEPSGKRIIWAQRDEAGAMSFWEVVATETAAYQPGYLSTVATTHDSTASDPGEHYYKVTAHSSANPSIFWESIVMSGHSVDNLAPAPPLALAAQRVGNYVRLDWNPSGEGEPDFAHYAVYRATASGVQPDPAYYLSTSTDTTLWDQGATPGTAWYYVVTAIDVHDNESAPSNEAMVDATTTGVEDTPVPTALMLRPNVPNPFNATTDIHIGLPRASAVSLDVFDVAGRRVASRSYHHMPSGWGHLAFDGLGDVGAPLPSGVYFYRITAAGETVTRKMVIKR